MTIGELRKIFKRIDLYRVYRGRKLQDDNSSIMLKIGSKTGYLTSVILPPVENKKGVGEKFILVSNMENGAPGYDKTKAVKMKSIVNWLSGSDSIKYSKAEIFLRIAFNGSEAEEPLEDVTFGIGISPNGFGDTPRHEYKKGAQTFFCDFDAIKEFSRRRAKKAIKWRGEYWTAREEFAKKRYPNDPNAGEYERSSKKLSINGVKRDFYDKYGEDLGESKEKVDEANLNSEEFRKAVAELLYSAQRIEHWGRNSTHELVGDDCHKKFMEIVDKVEKFVEPKEPDDWEW